MKEQPFRPDREPYIQRFDHYLPGIPAFIDLFADRSHFDVRPRVFAAWTAWQASGAGERMQMHGAAAFYEKFVLALEDAQEGLERVAVDFSGHPKEIEPIDEIGSCNDPYRLICMYDGERFDLPYEATELGRFEICRKLAIASQLLCISAADPYQGVTNNLTDVNLLANERLYEKNRQVVNVHYVLHGAEGHFRLNDQYPICVNFEDDVSAWCADTPQRLRIACRQVRDGQLTYYVYTSSRPKSRISGVFRLERGGTLTDRRGIMHVVVAVQRGKTLRAATRADVEAYAQVARRRLWRPPLREEPDTSPPNAVSHRDYWATKIIGFFAARLDGVPTDAPVEHQITAIGDRLNAEHATDSLGHRNYKREAIWQFVLPRWFPVARYGIPWGDKRVHP